MKKTALLFVFILIFSMVVFIPQNTEAVYDVKGYYNITWRDADADAVTDVVQRIVFTENITVKTISVQVGLQASGKHPDLTVGFGLYNNRTSYPFSDVPIKEITVSEGKNIVFDIYKKLAAGTYCLYFHVDQKELLEYVNLFVISGIKVEWYWKIPYTGNAYPGDVLLRGLDITYSWWPISTYSYTPEHDTYFNDVFAYILVESNDGGGGLDWLNLGTDSESNMPVYAAAAVAAIGGFVYLRRSRR